MFVQNDIYGNLFDKASELLPGTTKLAANYIGSDLAGLVSKHGEEGLKNITVPGFVAVISAVSSGAASSRGAKDALAEVFAKGGKLEEVIKSYAQQSDEGALKAIAEKIVAANPSVAADFKSGKEVALQFLVGQGMKESKGSANPSQLREAIKQAIL
jgi:aspartyl-tRNA(Asn)/glutamyl-tRNA(Gln) amidotransferase subunit B